MTTPSQVFSDDGDTPAFFSIEPLANMYFVSRIHGIP